MNQKAYVANSKSRSRRALLGVSTLIAILITVAGIEIVSASTSLHRGSSGAGGGPASGLGLRINGTLGQVAVGVSSVSSTLLRSGFWIPALSMVPASTDDLANPVPLAFRLDQNFPNPFGSDTTIRFALPRAERVQLVLFDIQGKAVQTLTDGKVAAGEHEYTLRADRLATGVYFYRLRTSRYSEVKKLTVLESGESR